MRKINSTNENSPLFDTIMKVIEDKEVIVERIVSEKIAIEKKLMAILKK